MQYATFCRFYEGQMFEAALVIRATISVGNAKNDFFFYTNTVLDFGSRVP